MKKNGQTPSHAILRAQIMTISTASEQQKGGGGVRKRPRTGSQQAAFGKGG